MNINKERMIKEFKNLVAIDSPSFGEGDMCRYLENKLNTLGLTVTKDNAGKIENSDSGNIYGYLKGTLDGEPILFCAHMDTVEPAKGKKAFIEENGRITSGGKTVLGADDCSGIAAILEALQTIKENNIPHRTIEVLFTIAEEVYCKGIKAFDLSKIKSKQAYVLDLSGPVGTAAYQAPTILSFEATVTGKASHAGFAPQNGIHAISAAAKAISRIKLGHTDNNTTVNIGIINGGTATNIVPDKCIVKGEVRSFLHKKALEQADIVKAEFKKSASETGAALDFKTTVGCEAYQIAHEHAVVKRFENACKKNGLSAGLVTTFGGSDENYLANNGISGLVVACSMNKCHSCDEYSETEELYKISELTVSLMTFTD